MPSPVLSEIASGAEAVILKDKDQIIKRRVSKGYRIEEIDGRLIRTRTKAEARMIKRAGEIIKTPKIIKISNNELTMEHIRGNKVRDILNRKNFRSICREIGKMIARLHEKDIVHGDLTTSNMILNSRKIYLIDFGLSFHSYKEEDKAVDLHLLRQAIESKHHEIYPQGYHEIIRAYSKFSGSDKVLKRLEKVESRGRNKSKGE